MALHIWTSRLSFQAHASSTLSNLEQKDLIEAEQKQIRWKQIDKKIC